MPEIAVSSEGLFSGSRYSMGAEIAPSGPSWKILDFFQRFIAEARSTSKFLQMARSYQELSASLEACASLSDGWDSYDAAKPAKHPIEAAGRFLRRLFAESFMPSRIVPSAEGGVALYFNSDERTAYLEYRNSSEVILAMFDDHSDPIIVELTESDADESRALSLIQSYITG